MCLCGVGLSGRFIPPVPGLHKPQEVPSAPLGSWCLSPGQRTFPGHPIDFSLLLPCFQVTLFVYSDLLLFTKEDEPGRCNVLRNPLYLQSVKLQEGECLQQQLEMFWGFFCLLARKNISSSAILPGVQSQHHPCYPGSSISWGIPGTLRPFPAFFGCLSQGLGALFPWLLSQCP